MTRQTAHRLAGPFRANFLHSLRTFGACSALAALSALGASAEAPAGVPAIPADVTDRIDALFLDYQTEKHVPGLVWGIVKDGELAYFKASGTANLETEAPVTEDSLFSIASMSKAFTALAILKLRDEGKLYLDAPAEYYVPELADWTYPTTDSPRIRVRDLLAHVSGLVTDNPWHRFEEEADPDETGTPTMIYIDRLENPKLRIFPVPSSTDTETWTIFLIVQTFAPDVSPKGVTGQQPNNSVLTGIRQAWQRWAVWQLAHDIGSGPVYALPDTRLQRFEKSADDAKTALLAYENREHESTPPISGPWGM